MKKLLLAVVVATLGFVGRAHAVCDPRTTTCLTGLEVTGTSTVTGTSAIVGNQTVSGNQTIAGTLQLSAPSSPFTRTIAQINALTASTTYQTVTCTDCVRSATCISTGSVNAGSWVVTVNTGSFVGAGLIGFTHCQ